VVGDDASSTRRSLEPVEQIEQVRWHLGKAAELGRSARLPIALFLTMAREIFTSTRSSRP